MSNYIIKYILTKFSNGCANNETTMPTGTSPEVLTFNMAKPVDLSWTYPEGQTSISQLERQVSHGILSWRYG